MGAIAGVVLAYAFRDIGPQRKIYQWPDEDEDEEEYPYNEFKGNIKDTVNEPEQALREEQRDKPEEAKSDEKEPLVIRIKYVPEGKNKPKGEA